MKKLRVAVVGAGQLGKIHAKLLPDVEGAELVAIADPSPLVQRSLIDQTDVPVISDYRKLFGKIDAAIVATPTRSHFDIAEDLLSHSIHTLIEKPITDCQYQARQLVELAEENECVLSVGHVEQFNPAIRAAFDVVGEAKFIQACRASSYTYRSTDIGVVQDLMIHDIDLVNSVFTGSLVDTQACGFAVFGEKEDIAQARLQFDCGGVANLTASRCSFEPQRSMQIFGTDGFAAVDLANHKVSSIKFPAWMKNRQFDFESANSTQRDFIKENLFDKILPVTQAIPEKCNAILEEQREWIRCILAETPMRNTGANATEAVRIAASVMDKISEHNWNGTGSNAGPVVEFETHALGILPTELNESKSQPQRKAA